MLKLSPALLVLIATSSAFAQTRVESVWSRDGRQVVDRIPHVGPGLPDIASAEPLEKSTNENGGERSATWSKMSVPGGLFLRAISMGTAQVGFAAGELGVVVRTTDGGNTWQTVQNLGFPYYWYGCYAFDGSRVIVSGFNNSTLDGVFCWSTNGGATWGPVQNLPKLSAFNWAIGVEFSDDQNGLIQGFSGQVFRTTSGGATAANWTVQQPSQNWYLGTFTFLPDQRAWISGYDTVSSTNGGASWTFSNGVDPLFDGPIAILAGGAGLIGGGTISPTVSGWAYSTTNGGATWSASRVLNTPYPVRALLPLDGQTAWAAGGDYFSNVGGIYATTNGGANWTLEQTIGNEMLDLDVVRVDSQFVDVYAAGYVSNIWRARVAAPLPCPGDFDHDGDVDLSDLGVALSAFGLTAAGDLDGDGDTDLSDLGVVLSAFGQPCPN